MQDPHINYLRFKKDIILSDEDFTDMQEIDYVDYDMYGNVIEQTIDTYKTRTPDEDYLVDHKRIENEYTNVIAQRRGNATESIVSRYDALDENIESLIDLL